MRELIELAQENVPWIATVLVFTSLFVEFTPVKINPLSWMFKSLKKKMTEDIQEDNKKIHKENEDINKRLDEVVYVKSKHYDEIVQWKEDINDIVKGLEAVNTKLAETMETMNSKIDEMYESQDENEMYRLRWEILSFSDSLRAGGLHSKDAFQHIFDVNDKYHAVIKKRGYVNGRIDIEMEFITCVYKKLLETDGFE